MLAATIDLLSQSSSMQDLDTMSKYTVLITPTESGGLIKPVIHGSVEVLGGAPTELRIISNSAMSSDQQESSYQLLHWDQNREGGVEAQFGQRTMRAMMTQPGEKQGLELKNILTDIQSRIPLMPGPGGDTAYTLVHEKPMTWGFMTELANIGTAEEPTWLKESEHGALGEERTILGLIRYECDNHVSYDQGQLLIALVRFTCERGTIAVFGGGWIHGGDTTGGLDERNAKPTEEEEEVVVVVDGVDVRKMGAKANVEWDCTACTFVNPDARGSCEMCNAWRPSTGRKKRQRRTNVPSPLQPSSRVTGSSAGAYLRS